jgi:hypothetical protein
VTARFIFAGMALLLCATSVFAGGAYQTTKDSRVTVWNDQPKPGDVAIWSGGHDREGYATGFGTLTWYVERQNRSTVYAQYFGNMVRGKFEGPVNAHSKGKTAHAVFAEGSRTSPWARGPAPSRNLAGSHAEPTMPESEAAKAENAEPRNETPPAHTRAETKAAKPSPTPSPVVARKRPEPARTKIPPAPPPTAATPAPSPIAKQAPNSMREADDSVRSLVGPPSSLRSASTETPAATPFDPNPPLSKDEVIDLADTLARAHGYNTSEYERSEAQHSEADDTWSLSYDQKPGEGMAESSKHFSVTVDGKTKKASIAPGN